MSSTKTRSGRRPSSSSSACNFTMTTFGASSRRESSRKLLPICLASRCVRSISNYLSSRPGGASRPTPPHQDGFYFHPGAVLGDDAVAGPRRRRRRKRLPALRARLTPARRAAPSPDRHPRLLAGCERLRYPGGLGQRGGMHGPRRRRDRPPRPHDPPRGRESRAGPAATRAGAGLLRDQRARECGRAWRRISASWPPK